MPIEGPLRELGIHDVFQLLDLARKTGVLTIRSDLRQNGGKVYFDSGAVIAALIETNPHPLGEVLLRSGKVTESDWRRARDMQEQGDARRLGEVLIAIDAISRRELERQVRAQVEEVIFELMGWAEGHFSFAEASVDDVPTQATVRIATEALLMEAARRIDEWSRIETRIPHVGVVPQLVAPDTRASGPMDLLPAEWQLLAAVDGERTVHQIAEVASRSDFDVAKVLFGMAAAGVIAIHDPRAASHGAAGGALSDLLARAEAYLIAGNGEAALAAAQEALATAGNDDGVCYRMYGRSLLALKRPGDAGVAFERALAASPLDAAARRLLGVALAAEGHFDEAIAAWDFWSRMTVRPADEDALGATVSEWRASARTLARAVRTAYE